MIWVGVVDNSISLAPELDSSDKLISVSHELSVVFFHSILPSFTRSSTAAPLSESSHSTSDPVNPASLAMSYALLPSAGVFISNRFFHADSPVYLHITWVAVADNSTSLPAPANSDKLIRLVQFVSA